MGDVWETAFAAFRVVAGWWPGILGLPIVAAAWFYLTRVDRPEDEPWAKKVEEGR